MGQWILHWIISIMRILALIKCCWVEANMADIKHFVQRWFDWLSSNRWLAAHDSSILTTKTRLAAFVAGIVSRAYYKNPWHHRENLISNWEYSISSSSSGGKVSVVEKWPCTVFAASTKADYFLQCKVGLICLAIVFSFSIRLRRLVQCYHMLNWGVSTRRKGLAGHTFGLVDPREVICLRPKSKETTTVSLFPSTLQ